MNVAKLAERQLFLMKAENLEKRVRAYYAQTQDVDSLIEYGVAILVRSFFCMGSFSELIQDLIQEVYFTVEPTAVMRQYLPYFEDYFTENEWQTIVNRLFGNHTTYLAQTEEARVNKGYLEQTGTLDNRIEGLVYRVEAVFVVNRLFGNHTTYLAQTEEARVNKGYLEQTGTLDNRIEGLVYRVEAVFEDTIGKKHKLTIRDTDSTFNEAQTIQVLNILTTLSIFDTADVRKYETYVSYQTPGKIIATSHNSRQKTKPTAKEPEILTTLSIFDTADVRKYETYVSYQTPGKIIATSHNSRQKTKPTAKEPETIAALSIFDTADVRKYETYVSYQTPGKIIATSHNSRQKTKPTAKEPETIAAQQDAQQSEKAPKKMVAAAKTRSSAAPASTVSEKESNKPASNSTATKEKQSSPANPPKNTNSPSPNVEAKKKANELLQQPDMSYKRVSKNEEQIQANGNSKKMKNKINNALGRSKNRKRNKRK